MFLYSGFLGLPNSYLPQAFDLLFLQPGRLLVLDLVGILQMSPLSESSPGGLSLGRERDDETPPASLKRVVSSLQTSLHTEGILIGNQELKGREGKADC